MRTSIPKWRWITFAAIILVAVTYFARQDHPIEEDMKTHQKGKSVLSATEMKAALESLDNDPIEKEYKKITKMVLKERTDEKENSTKLNQSEKIIKECCDCLYEDLSKNILEFYNRNNWWDAKLCKEKIGTIRSNISDIIPLKTLNKDIWPNKNHLKNIYFIEDNCMASLQLYVLCAIESAAQLNPEDTVFLLTAIPFIEDKSKAVRTLLERHSNIRILQADFDDILKETPLEGYRSEEVWTKNTDFLKAHMSDVMRVALVWKEGGTYMDTDIITVKRQPPGENAVVHGTSDIFNGFIRTKKHHPYLEVVMNHQKSNYDRNNFGSIGPKSTTVGATQYCGITTFKDGMCKDVVILPIESFTLVIWDKAEMIMTPHSTTNITEFLVSSFGFHTSHFILKEKLNTVQKDSMYDKITKEFCPISYQYLNHI